MTQQTTNQGALRAISWSLGSAGAAESRSGDNRSSRWSGTSRAAAGELAAPRRGRRRARVSRRDVADFTSQLAIMIRTGVDITSALGTLAKQRRADALRNILEEVHGLVMGGAPLSESLASYADVFGKTYVASVAAGEKSGRLPDVLQQLAALLRTDMKLRNSLRAVLAYPVILTVVSSAVLASLVLFVLPRFEKIFDDFHAPLPVLTRVLLAVSGELHTHWWFFLPLFVSLVGGAVLFLRSGTGRRAWDHVALHLVVLREVTRSLLVGRTCRLLGLMLESGVPLIECLRLVRGAVNNSLYRDLFDRLEGDVLNGRGLSAALADNDFVPVAAAEMITTAEKAGMLAAVTQMVGQHFEEDGEARLRELVAVVEPVVTVALGIGVAIIVMSVMFPLFDLSSAVKGG